MIRSEFHNLQTYTYIIVIAIVRQNTWFLGYPITSSIFAPCQHVNLKLKNVF